MSAAIEPPQDPPSTVDFFFVFVISFYRELSFRLLIVI